jgi:hypothetical protein
MSRQSLAMAVRPAKIASDVGISEPDSRLRLSPRGCHDERQRRPPLGRAREYGSRPDEKCIDRKTGSCSNANPKGNSYTRTPTFIARSRTQCEAEAKSGKGPDNRAKEHAVPSHLNPGHVLRRDFLSFVVMTHSDPCDRDVDETAFDPLPVLGRNHNGLTRLQLVR